MRPCTPYAIYVAENSIWEGAYFYCGGLMKDTFYGIVHHLMYSKLFPRENSPNYIKMLHRTIQFYYRAFIENQVDERGMF